MKKGRIALSWADERARRHKFPHLLIFNMRFLSSSPILYHNNCLCWKNSPRYATPPTNTGVIIESGHRTIGRKAASARGIHIEGGSILELGGIFISPRRYMDHGVGPRLRKLRPLDPEKIRFLLDLVKFNLFSWIDTSFVRLWSTRLRSCKLCKNNWSRHLLICVVELVISGTLPPQLS